MRKEDENNVLSWVEGTAVEYETPIQLSHIIVEATEMAAIAAASKRGLGKKIECDQAAVVALQDYLNGMPIRGLVVLGEGEMDESSYLCNGQKLGALWKSGSNELPNVDILVDPLEGTELAAKGQFGALTVAAISEHNGFLKVPECYVLKLVVPMEARGEVSLNDPMEKNLKAIAKGLGRRVDQLNIVVLEREWNMDLINEIREAGASVQEITDGDLFPGVAACMENSGVHGVCGIGKSTEALLTATAVRALRGEIQMKLWPYKKTGEIDERKLKEMHEMGLDTNRIYTTNDMVKGSWTIFSSTAVTQCYLGMQGVSKFEGGVRTRSLVITQIGEDYLTRKWVDNSIVYDPNTKLAV